MEEKELPTGAKFGFRCGSVVIDVPVYLGWYVAYDLNLCFMIGECLCLHISGNKRADWYRLQVEILKAGIEMRRAIYADIKDVFRDYPSTKVVFNCTGLGSYTLKGVEDKSLYPSRVWLCYSITRFAD